MSPRPGPRKPSITVRLPEELLAEVTDWADRTGIPRTRSGDVNRSAAIERLLRAGLRVEPVYRPRSGCLDPSVVDPEGPEPSPSGRGNRPGG